MSFFFYEVPSDPFLKEMPTQMSYILGPTITNSWILGLILGVTYHFICQYPRQLEVLQCLYAFALANNVWFLVEKLLVGGVYRLWLEASIFNLALISSALVCKILYNVYFRHRGIPTTFFMSATDWGLYKHGFQGDLHFKVAQMHKDLGPIVRVAPNHISFNSLEAVEDIHGIHTKLVKASHYTLLQAIGNLPGNIVTERLKSIGSAVRTFQTLFTSASMNTFEPKLRAYCDQFMSAIRGVAERDGVVDFKDWFHRLAFDISGGISISRDFGALKGGETHFYIKALAYFAPVAQLMFCMPWLFRFLVKFPSPNSLDKARRRLLDFTREKVKEDMKRPSADVTGIVQKAIDPETGLRLTEEDALSNADIFIAAGSDTTSIAMTFLLYHLLANQRFHSADEITNSALLELPFLEAVIYETLRLRPSVTANFPREVPQGGTIIAGQYISSGTIVSTPIYAMLHDERYFSNPGSFIPTRWIETERGGETCNKAAWIPFSYGARNCIGKPLALMEIRITVALLVWWFDVEFIEEGQGEPYYKDVVAAAHGPLRLRIKPIR